MSDEIILRAYKHVFALTSLALNFFFLNWCGDPGLRSCTCSPSWPTRAPRSWRRWRVTAVGAYTRSLLSST